MYMDYLIKLGIPIITSLIVYFTARYQGKTELKKQIELNNTELQKVREQCKNELDKIQSQLDKQAELYERNAQTDIVSGFFNNALNNPNKAAESMKGLLDIAKIASEFQNK